MIIDSSILIVERIANLLYESGKKITVYPAVSSEAAALALENIILDVVLLELSLPGSQSLLLLKKIKEIDNYIQVILLTSEQDIFNKSRYTTLGADLFLDKYHEFEKIPAAIDSVLIQRRILLLQNNGQGPE